MRIIQSLSLIDFRMNKSEAVLKDKVLEYLATVKKSESDGVIAKHIGYEGFEVGFASEQLKQDGLVELMNITSYDSKRINEYIVTLQTKGDYFFLHRSYISQYNNWKQKYNWRRLKIIAATANALIIISIAAMSVWVNYQNNTDKRSNQQLHERVNELELQLKAATDSIGIIKKDSIN